MASKSWNEPTHEAENDSPVPPFTKCTAIKDFAGEQPNDLPFKRGEVLIVIEPCNVVYWYLAENNQGQRGVIPITYVKLHTSNASSQKKPPPPPPPSDSPSGKQSNASPLLPPLPPKPAASPSSSSSTKSYMTFPRLAMNSPEGVRKKVTRAHSNEFYGAQSSHSTPITHTPSHISPPLSRQSNHSPPLPHTLNPPLFTPSPLHNAMSSVPPPLPSPRNKAKAVAPPVAPKVFTKDQPPLPEQHVSLPSSSSAQTQIQSRQLPPAPGGASLDRKGSLLDIDRRPPAPLPPEMKSKSSSKNYSQTSVTKYKHQKDFVQNSGWFTPSLETVLCKMMYSGQVTALTSITTGIYIFTHKHQRTKRYVGKSRTAYHDLVQMFHRLYEKKENKLSVLERELKFNSPDAEQWTFRIYSVSSADLLESEANKRILQNNTLHPNGMNTEIRFCSKESFYLFAETYAKMMREKASMSVNPIRAAAKGSH